MEAEEIGSVRSVRSERGRERLGRGHGHGQAFMALISQAWLGKVKGSKVELTK